MDREQMIIRLNEALESLADAEGRLARATALFHRARAEALLGERYDEHEYDQIVGRYKRARREVEEAHHVYRRCRQALVQGPAPETARLPLNGTPTLLVTWWLYRHGYLGG